MIKAAQLCFIFLPYHGAMAWIHRMEPIWMSMQHVSDWDALWLNLYSRIMKYEPHIDFNWLPSTLRAFESIIDASQLPVGKTKLVQNTLAFHDSRIIPDEILKVNHS